MSLADSLRLTWLGGITDSTGVRSWNTDKLFGARSVTVSSVTPNDVTLYVSNATDSRQYFAQEADRFASAAFESILVGSRSDAYPRSTGWLLIRAYYGAFFSVHALMRIHGWACTRLTAANLKGVNDDIAVLFSSSQRFSAGLYLVKSESGGRDLRCRSLDSSLGGTHEILWSLLKDYLDEVTNVVLSDPNPSGQALAVAIEDFLTLIDGYGGAKWFSTVRNRVNYMHDYGA